MSIVEPRIWSGITDALPADHPLAHETVNCTNCAEMVHAFNNENMQDWVETGKGAWCIGCFIGAIHKVTRDVGGRRPDGSPWAVPGQEYYEIDDEWGLQS